MNIPLDFQGNYIDLIILSVLLVWIIDGWQRGFFSLFADLVSFLGSFLFGLRFYSRAAYIFIEYFSLTRGIANALGYFLVYVLAHSIIALLLVGALRGIPLKHFSKWWHKFLGIFPAAVNGLLIVSVLLAFAVGLPIKPDVKADIFESKIGGYLVKRTSAIERALDEVFGEALEEGLAFLTIKPESTERIDLGKEVSRIELKVSEEDEFKMYELVNAERIEAGVARLEWDARITPTARAHAQDMFEEGYFSHISLEGKDVGDRLREAGIDFAIAGENLAFAPSLSVAHDGLMNSPGHRENILAGEFGRVGIGVIDGGAYGKMFVQVFAD